MLRWRGGCRLKIGFLAFPGQRTQLSRGCRRIYKSDCCRTQYAKDGQVTSCEPRLARQNRVLIKALGLDQVIGRLIVGFFSELSKEAGHGVGVHTEQASSSALVAAGCTERLPHGRTAQLAQVHER